MRWVVAVTTIAWAAQYSGPAGADLYRWVDPDTGSVKFSSYPPPWYGDPAKDRRAPKVEVIPERVSTPSSGPKPDEEARPEPKRAARPDDGVRPEPKRAAKPVDTTPDGPAGKAAPRPEPSAMKERPGDGR